MFAERAAAANGVPIHPMRLAKELQAPLSDDMTLCLDMGSFHIWLARHPHSFRARQILMTNGQQTLGVGLPWAIRYDKPGLRRDSQKAAPSTTTNAIATLSIASKSWPTLDLVAMYSA